MRRATVVLAEKPSVARELAAYLHASSRRDGYFEGSGYRVTWAYGHLVGLQDFSDYDPAMKQWRLEHLPFVPDSFRLKLTADGIGKKQFRVIRTLFREAESLICATDAGREGELIFRYITEMTGVGGIPVRRLWLRSLTPSAIAEGFRTLRPGRDFDRLYHAARSRSEADWIVGLNATRNYTIRYGERRRLWSVGRVQTPVLALIVRRDDDIRTFTPEPFWDLRTRYRNTEFNHAGKRFTSEQAATELLATVLDKPFTITSVQRKREKLYAPALYDLTDLQRDMNRRFGASAANTLKAAQSLYEKKLITYPRTDSRYLGSDMKSTIPRILAALKPKRPDAIAKLNLQRLPHSSRVFNDRKVTDHHAIIPTEKAADTLSGLEQHIYDAVVTRLIAVFYPPCEKDVTRVAGKAADVAFKAKGATIVAPGWTALYPKRQNPKARAADTDQTEPVQKSLPVFTVGEQGPHAPFIKEGVTQPPKPYTENTLLAAMETAGRLVDDENLRDALKERGLGTPATRAGIIEILITRAYIERNKKQLIATATGRYLIALIRNDILKSAEMTGDWEQKLKRIEVGDFDAPSFRREVVQFTEQICGGAAGDSVDPKQIGRCPRCDRPMIQGRKGYGCSGWKDGCDYVLWMDFHGHTLTTEEARELMQMKRLLAPVTVHHNGVDEVVMLYRTDGGEIMEIPWPLPEKPRKSGRNRNAARKSGVRKKTAADGDSIGACPACGKAVIETPKAFGCSGWKDGCGFVIWRKMAGRTISKTNARTLLRKGETATIKGFKSKSGNPFQAKLKIVGAEVKMDFG